MIGTICHRLMTALLSTFPGSTARHLHNTTALLFAGGIVTQHQTLYMQLHAAFHRSSNPYTRKGPILKFHSSKRCHALVHVITSKIHQGPFWSAVFYRKQHLSILTPVPFYFWGSCSFFWYLDIAVIVSIDSWRIFLHRKNIPKAFFQNFGPKRSTWRDCFDSQWSATPEWCPPCCSLIM